METEAKVNNLRIKVLEDEVALLQKKVDEIQFSEKAPIIKRASVFPTDPVLLSANEKNSF